MRVLIVTSGSMGDIAPYTGLGSGLREAGHEVTVAAHEPFRASFAGVGLAFQPLPGDMRRILPQAHGQDGRGSGTGPRALAQLLRIARPIIEELGAGIVDAVEQTRPEAILLSTVVAPLGYQVAEAAGVPWAGVFLQPVSPTGDFGSVLLGGRSVGRWGNRAITATASRITETLYAGPVHDLRARLGLPRQSISTLRSRQDGPGHPTFHGFSSAVVPRPTDWPARLAVVGYWWPARPAGWEPPAALADFLKAGPPPVFIGFGSMAPDQGERLSAPILAAVQATGLRAVVQAGWAGLNLGAGDDILSIGPVPHDWLFPRTAAVVHHSGAGTSAAGLRAGVPAIPVPVLADQPFWARRLHRLGAATPPIPLSKLTPDNLARALTEATTNPHLAARAAAVSAQLDRDDSTARILTWLSP